MTPTEKQLLAVHSAPVIRLADICESYLGKNYPNARRDAVTNRLPFAAFKLNESQKAPWMVQLSDLAAYIDKQADEAKTSWMKSNT